MELASQQTLAKAGTGLIRRHCGWLLEPGMIHLVSTALW